MISVSSAGDLGDVAFLCGILAELPEGPHTLVLRDNGKTHGIERHVEFLRPLLEAQPYIKSLEVYNGQKLDWESEQFRYEPRIHGTTLLDAHWRHGKKVLRSTQEIRGLKPWLTVKPDSAFKGRVVVSRTPRYRNEFFPWPTIMRTLGPRAVFVGLESEHSEFCASYGYLPRHEFDNALELARAIAGSDLFIGNQSFPNAVNEGLKHDSIQETCIEVPDCLFARPNAQWVFDGRVTLDEVQYPCAVVDPAQINTDVTPPGGWQYPVGDRIITNNTLGGLRHILTNNGASVSAKQILAYTAQRLEPEYYKVATARWLPRVRLAFETAGIPLTFLNT